MTEQREAIAPGNMATCPQCGSWVGICLDGTVVEHWYTTGYSKDARCVMSGSPMGQSAIWVPGKGDSVNHPPHYNKGKFEVIDVIEDWGLGFNLGNSVKYIARADHKGTTVEDLRKAAWYLNREIERRSK